MTATLFTPLKHVAHAVGKGLIAGLAGTIAITVSQMIEMQITKRGLSNAPVKVGGDVLGVEPKGLAEQEKEKHQSESGKSSAVTKEQVETNEQRFSQLMHYGYGSGWGVARGALDLAGVRDLPASILHFGAIWGTALVMLPAAGASEPVTKWTPKQIAIDIVHHAVYAIAAGVVYDGMVKAGK